ALEMLKASVKNGRKIIEPSSGNTGIALTCIANAMGIAVEIAVPEGIPDEKKIILRFLGAIVMEADDSLCPLFPNEGARGLVRSLIESPATRNKYMSPNQYENQLNVQAHYTTTGPEIWNQTRGKIDYFFAGFGTCGTITGVGKYLKEKNPDVRIIGVEPSTQNHKLPGMKRITGLSSEFVPKILDMSAVDEVFEVRDEEAYSTALELARKEGIPAGPTTGAILYAALQYSRYNKGLAVIISPDDAFKYASFYKDVLETEMEEIQRKEYDLKSGETPSSEAEIPQYEGKPGKSKYDQEEGESPSIDAPNLKYKERAEEKEYNLGGLVCPASKMEAVKIVDGLVPGDSARIILGDRDSFISVLKELKSRNLKPTLTKEGENRFILTITK
ncbi:MAG: PLP-dependent cysteine synthase family protein, partial [Fidelibacterota bacterium]